ncbi:MAG: O-antigen ligase family protein [Ruminococcus sp.]|nr:O-antigen ligase family protein [Candidatus Copronaster equi]
MAGQIFPGALNACLVAFNEDVQKKMKRMTPYISVIFSVVALLCTINPSGETSGNLISNEENGFGYQTVSYVAAFSSALAEYYLLNKNNVEQSFIFKKQLGNILAIAVIFVDFLITLLSGGRGGFVTYFVFLAASFFFYAKTNKIDFSTIVKAFFAVFVIVCLGFGAVKIAENSALSTSGFSRIMGFVSGGGDEGRAALREQALQMFLRKPLLGNGLGSVYYELGIYSHNLFTDVLAETGIVGLIFFVSLFIYTFYCSVRIVRVDKSDLLWIYILIGGFIFSMFSGYYLTRIQLWLELIFIICKYRYNRLVGR